MMDYNLHTHSWYCGHGTGTIREYALEAMKKGLRTLGFTEHLPYEDRRITSTMDYSQKDAYIADVRANAAEFSSKGLRIYQGWECDWYPDMGSCYEELKAESDYLIFGNHYLVEDGTLNSVFFHELDKRELHIYADSLIAGMSTGLFAFIAHPDVIFINYEHFDSEAKAISREIIDAAIDLDLPLEANGNGLVREKKYGRAPYPMRGFWDMAVERGVKVVPSTDAHAPENVARSLPMLDDYFSCYPGFRFAELKDILPFAV